MVAWCTQAHTPTALPVLCVWSHAAEQDLVVNSYCTVTHSLKINSFYSFLHHSRSILHPVCIHPLRHTHTQFFAIFKASKSSLITAEIGSKHCPIAERDHSLRPSFRMSLSKCESSKKTHFLVWKSRKKWDKSSRNNHEEVCRRLLPVLLSYLHVCVCATVCVSVGCLSRRG